MYTVFVATTHRNRICYKYHFYKLINCTLTFCTVVLCRSECRRRITVRNVNFKTLLTTVYNLSIYKTVSVETLTQHSIYLCFTSKIENFFDAQGILGCQLFDVVFPCAQCVERMSSEITLLFVKYWISNLLISNSCSKTHGFVLVWTQT